MDDVDLFYYVSVAAALFALSLCAMSVVVAVRLLQLRRIQHAKKHE